MSPVNRKKRQKDKKEKYEKEKIAKKEKQGSGVWWDKILGSKPATADTKRNGGGREGKIRERKGINMIQLPSSRI